MAIKITFNGASIIKPGAYSKTIVQNLSGFPLQETGIVGIIGEAPGGEPNVIDILTREGIQDAKARYKTSNIADALGILAAPSGDPRIVNGASTIVVYKTNAGTQGTLNLANAVPADIITLTSKNWGVDENNINYTLAAGTVASADAEIEGTVAGDYTLAGSETLIVDINAVQHTFTNTLSGTVTAANLIIEMNDDTKWSPGNAPITAAPNTLTTGIKITIDPVVTAGSELDYGYISVDATSTIDTILGITGANRGDRGSRIFTGKNGTFEEISSEIGGVSLLTIGYSGAGTSCLLSIQDTVGERKFTTTCAGASGDDLDILLENTAGANQQTLQSLADQINALANWSASAVGPNPDRNANELDYQLNLELLDVDADLRADIFDTKYELDTFGTLVDVTIISNAIRALDTFATATFLTSATDGTSTNTDFVNALIAFESVRINTIVPLISEDTGALTIDSINASVKSHLITMWSTTGKSERNGFMSKNDSKANFRAAARTVNSAYASMVGQQVKILDNTGTLVWRDPWSFACVCAGLQAGSEVGEPITFKLMNVNDLRVEDLSWDPKKDFAAMLGDGCTIAEPLDTGGFRVVLGNTTHITDASFVYNRVSVVEAAGFVAYDLRYNLELTYTGTKAKTGTAESIKNFITARMTIYRDADIIVGDDLNDGLGFKDLSVTITGNTAAITMSVTPVQGIDFLLPTIYLADILQTAA